MQTRKLFFKYGIILACLCCVFAISSDFVKIESTKAYVFSLSDKCVNTFIGDASGSTTEPSTEPSTEHGEETTTRPASHVTDDKPAGSDTDDTESTTLKANTDKISPPTGAQEATSNLFIILPFAAAFIASISIRKSKHSDDLSVK